MVGCASEPPLTFKMFKVHAAALVCVFLTVVTLLAGCQQKETLPRPEFPLSEETLVAALDETGLLWSIKQTDKATVGTMKKITYSLYRPESGRDYNSVFILSYDSDELGRRLQILFHEPQNKQWWTEEKESVACWEDWRDMLVLVARLYGGFEDAEEIYRACAAVELPKDEHLLWEGTLTGGYFYMQTQNHMKPERFSMGNTVSFNVYESEQAYLKYQRMLEERREESNSQ